MKSFGRRHDSHALLRSAVVMAVAVLTSFVVSGFSRTLAAEEQPPWFGTWEQVPPATKWFNPSPYRKVTLRIEPWKDGLKVVYDMVRRRGGITHMEWTGRFDGRDYPVQGVDYVLTNAYRRLSDRSYQIVVRVDGRAAAVATAIVSPDGKRLTVDTVENDGSGGTRNTTAVYLRE